MSTLDAARVLRIHALHIPPAGGGVADLSLDATALPTVGALATLVCGDLVFIARVTVADFDDNPSGARPRVTLRAGAGWDTPLTRKGEYGPAPGGVRLSTVLRDLAGLAGEAYDAPAEALLSADYRWPAATPREPVAGRHVLADLATRGAVLPWRVDPTTGRTTFTAWPTTGAADGAGRVLGRNLSRGRRTVGLDARVAAFLPGSTLEGAPIARLLIREDAGKLRAEVYEQ